jgi:hypothetical protein
MQECQAMEIITSGGEARGVRASKGELAGPIVVNAASPWVRLAGLMAGVEIPIDTWTHDVMYIKRPASIQTYLTVIDDALAMYFRPESGRLTLLALEDNGRIGESPDAAECVAADFVMSAIEYICQRMPELEARGRIPQNPVEMALRLASTRFCARRAQKDFTWPAVSAVLDSRSPWPSARACLSSSWMAKRGRWIFPPYHWNGLLAANSSEEKAIMARSSYNCEQFSSSQVSAHHPDRIC